MALPASAHSVYRASLGVPGDRFEREADRIAEHFDRAPATAAGTPPSHARCPSPPSGVARFLRSSGRPLDSSTRIHMESRFGVDLGHVRIHTGRQAEELNRDLGAHAFTQGADIFYGRTGTPGNNALTAHEIAHVMQQSGGSADSSVGSISNLAGTPAIQCDYAAFRGHRLPIAHGSFDYDLRTYEGARDLGVAGGLSGMEGWIRFIPAARSQRSNEIEMIQIERITNSQGADLPAFPGDQPQRGRLGSPGRHTEEDLGRGVEGGYSVAAGHEPGDRAGSDVPLRYPWIPAPPGLTGIGHVEQPPEYGGGMGGVRPVRHGTKRSGFKRGSTSKDVRSAALYVMPGIGYDTDRWKFSFETVARGMDERYNYGAITWGFEVEGGVVSGQHVDYPWSSASATFDEALDRHRDAFIHEPVTFYFEPSGSTVLKAKQAAKADAVADYLRRNTHAEIDLTGYADIEGGNSHANEMLSLKRALAVRQALMAKGIESDRMRVLVGGATTNATPDAGQGDQGGDARAASDQMRGANRGPNRRVVVSFRYDPNTWWQ